MILANITHKIRMLTRQLQAASAPWLAVLSHQSLLRPTGKMPTRINGIFPEVQYPGALRVQLLPLFHLNGSTNVTATVRGYNSACNVYSPYPGKSLTVDRTALVVNEITGPDYVSFGAPSVINHYVNNISGVDYTWTSSPTSLVPPTKGSSIYVNAASSGSFTLKLTAIGCGSEKVKTKTVTATNGTPTPPYISQYPYTHCAGSCATYYTQIPSGNAVERQFRYNYGSWYVANSNGAMLSALKAMMSATRLWNSIERHMWSVWLYIFSINQYIQLRIYDGNSAEDSLAISELSVENDITMYPNPSTTTMTISLPEDMQISQVTVLSDQGMVITTFENTKTIFTINTEKLLRGKYFLSVAAKSNKLTKHFVVE